MGWEPDDADDGTPFDRQRTVLLQQLRDREDIDDRALEALAAVPRHEFVPADQRQHAYADHPLPIGEGQTISAPHMVAIMVDRLDLEAGHRTLEIGTGCGYHAAVTAEVVGAKHVDSVEYRESLAEEARDRLAEVGYDGVSVTVGDGHDGWPARAPYDRIYLTAAATSVPDPLLEQLAPGGVFLGPIGDRQQTLVRVCKHEDGSTEREALGDVRFVRMQREDSA